MQMLPGGTAGEVPRRSAAVTSRGLVGEGIDRGGPRGAEPPETPLGAAPTMVDSQRVPGFAPLLPGLPQELL